MGADMPAEIRHFVRARQHPARAVACPHCGAAERRPCRSQKRTRLMPQPHPSRVAAWVRASVVCPACQVEAGMDCNDGGWPLHSGAVHPQRQAVAEEAAA